MAYEGEQEIIARTKSGDRRAFDELWGRYQEAIRGYIAVRVDDNLEVDALLNDAALTVWQKIGFYSERWKFYTFARYWAGIAVLRYYRRQSRWTSLHLLLGDVTEGVPQIWVAGAGGLEELTGQGDPGENFSAQEYASILKTALTDGGKPHQTICFAYCKLIRDWGPKRIVRDLSDFQLRDIERRLERDYLRESGLPATAVADCFNALRLTVSGPVGLTRLGDYYGANPEDTVSDWAYKVRGKTFRAIEREKSALAANMECDDDEQTD